MPTLSFSPAGTAPPMLAASPIAPAPTGDGTGDAFMSLLAGLTAAPVEGGLGASPAPAPASGAPLPQVRQDPAAWLPGEPDAEQAPGGFVVKAMPAPALQPSPTALAPLEIPPDCEMPAFDPGQPKLEQPVPAEPTIVALPVAPKSWTLRLTSALAPARFAPKQPEAEPSKTIDEEPEADPVIAVGATTPAVVADLPLPAPVVRQAEPPAQPQPTATEEPKPAELAAVRAPSVPTLAVRAPAAMETTVPAQPAVAEQPSDQSQPQQQQHAAPAQEPNRSPVDRLSPELARQVAQVVEQVARPAAKPVSAPEPIQTVAPVATPQPQAAAVAPQQAAPTFQPAPVDLGRADWVQAMVDRIADLPRALGGREAQIRLIPDALGVVEVKIAERDERLQVTLNAETAQARQLLSDAAPRLQELAEARGLRFAQTEVGGGQSQDRRPPQDQQPQTPQRPRPASAGRNADPQPQGELIA